MLGSSSGPRDFGAAAPRVGQCWGKSDGLGLPYPLVEHLADSAAMTGALWDLFLTRAQRAVVSSGFGLSEAQCRGLLMALAGMHDVGKVSPGFQAKDGRAAPPEVWGVAASDLAFSRHAEIGGWAAACGGPAASQLENNVLAGVIAGHHGVFPPGVASLNELSCGGRAWTELRRSLMSAVWAAFAPARVDPPSAQAAVLASGCVVLADWLASDTAFIQARQRAGPLATNADVDNPGWWAAQAARRAGPAAERVRHAGLADVGLPAAVGFEDLFGFTPRGVQRALIDTYTADPPTGPEMLIVAVPTGEGKTEAGLWAAHQLAAASGADGLLVCLPTMATTDAMFSRVARHLGGLPGDRQVTLVHGRADLNAAYRVGSVQPAGVDAQLTATSNPGEVAAWLRGSRRGILARYSVATVDHLLLAGLAHRHLPLRMLGVTGRVVVVDEVHAADPYMLQLLRRVLRWLGVCRVPVVLLSATVSGEMAASLMAAYSGGPQQPIAARNTPLAYPGFVRVRPDRATATVVASQGVNDREVTLRLVTSDDPGLACEKVLEEQCRAALAEPGVVGLVVNTVGRAQALYRALAGQAGAAGAEVVLLHARLPLGDRLARTERLLASFGPMNGGAQRPERALIIATQIAEQSLDIDVDLMITELAPAAQLIQRLGRVWRHPGRRRPPGMPGPTATIVAPIAPDGQVHRGTTRAWPFYTPGGATATLQATLVQLRLHPVLRVPGDVQGIVDAVYGIPDWTRMPADRMAAWLAERHAASADAAVAATRTIPDPDDLDPSYLTPGATMHALTTPADPDDVAQTRLGASGPLILPLHPDPDGQGWRTSDGRRLPVPDAVDADLLRRLLLASIPSRPTAPWLDGLACLADPDVGGPGYSSDRRTAGMRVLAVDGHRGTCDAPPWVVGVDPDIGLWDRREG